MKLLKQNYVAYGLVMSGLTAGWLIFMDMAGQYSNMQSKSSLDMVFIMVTPAIVWYFGLKEKRKQLKGKMNFKQGFLEAFKISVVYAVTSPFIYLIYYSFINPSIINFLRNEYGFRTLTNGAIIAIDMFAQFVSAIIGGTVYGAVLAFILRRRSAKA